MAVGSVELGIRFGPHPLRDGQAEKFNTICSASLRLALLIDELVPDSREKADALTNLEYVMYQANAGISRRER